MPDLYPLFVWFEDTTIGVAVRESIWAFPVIEAVHLLALCLLGGALLVVDLRMLGTGLSGVSVSQVRAYARPWLVGAIALLIATGVPLFLSEAVKCFYNLSFWVKMVGLVVGLGFTFGVRERVARQIDFDVPPRARAVAVGSLAIWFTVAAAGRWIGYS
jgi:hypothetical protein